MSNTIKSCFIISSMKKIIISTDTANCLEILLDEESVNHLDKEKLLFVSDINRKYCSNMFKKMIQNEKVNMNYYDGCLPSKCLFIEGEVVYISPQYLINCFIHWMELLFKTNEGQSIYFIRDVQNISIPASSDKMEQFVSQMTDNTFSYYKENSDSDGYISDLYTFFQLIMEQLTNIQSNFEEKVKQAKKKSNIIGGMRSINFEKDVFKLTKNEFKDSFSNCSQIIHDYVSNNRDRILKVALDVNNDKMYALKRIFEILARDTDICLYENLSISLQLMLDAIGEIFNILFNGVLPSHSIFLSFAATVYHTAVLNELNLLEKFSNTIYLPLLFRLVYSCFNDDNANTQHKQYLSTDYNTILNHIGKLNGDDDNNINILCSVAQKINLKDQKCLDSIYWHLNKVRGFTIEYYLIMISAVYVMYKCANINRMNKISNAKQFLTPIYKVFSLFLNYVRTMGLNQSLCSSTFENFGKVYQTEIKAAIRNLSFAIGNHLQV